MRLWLTILVAVTCAACGTSATTESAPQDASTDATAGSDAATSDTTDDAQGTDAIALPAPHTDTLGGARPVAVTVPDNWTPEKKWPLVLVLHGYGASGLVQSAFLGVEARATQYGYVTLAPDGTRDPGGSLFWNATPACCDFGNVKVDDVAYLTGLIDAAIKDLAVDPARVYVVGHSNGGFMAYRLACEKSEKITAIAVIAGATNPDPTVCGTPKAVNVLHIHGTNDDTIKYDGGTLTISGFGGAAYPSAKDSMSQWLTRNGCGTTSTSTGTGDFDMSVAGEETERLSYTGCPSGIVVDHWKMNGAKHIPAFTDDFREALATWMTARTRP